MLASLIAALAGAAAFVLAAGPAAAQAAASEALTAPQALAEPLEVRITFLEGDAGALAASGLGADLVARLAAARREGALEVISEPAYAARSGSTLTLRVFGTAPDALNTLDPGADERRLTLKLTPIVLESGAIRLDAESVLGKPGEGGAPVATSVELAEGQAALLAGLATVRDASAVKKPAAWRKLPLVGRLAKPPPAQAHKDLLVMVSVKLLKPDGPTARATAPDAVKLVAIGGGPMLAEGPPAKVAAARPRNPVRLARLLTAPLRGFRAVLRGLGAHAPATSVLAAR